MGLTQFAIDSHAIVHSYDINHGCPLSSLTHEYLAPKWRVKSDATSTWQWAPALTVGPVAAELPPALLPPRNGRGDRATVV